MNKPFSDITRKELVDLYVKQKKPSTEIAGMYGVSYHRVIAKLRKNNIKIRKPGYVLKDMFNLPKLNKKAFLKDYYSGIPLEKIAYKHKLSITTLDHRIKSLGLEKRRPNIELDLDIKKIRRSYEHNGKSVNMIAKDLGVSYNAVNRRVKKHGFVKGAFCPIDVSVLKHEYKTMSIKEISKKHCVSEKRVSEIIRDNKIGKRG